MIDELISEAKQSIDNKLNHSESCQHDKTENTLPPYIDFVSDSIGAITKRPDVLGYSLLAGFVLGLIPVLGYVLSTILVIPFTYLALYPESKFTDGLTWLKNNFFPSIWVHVLIFLVIFGGLILFIIPGVIAMMYILLVYVLLIANNERGLNALVKSTKMISGVWWAVTLRILLLVLVLGIALGIAEAVVSGLFSNTLYPLLLKAITSAFEAVTTFIFCVATVQIYRSREKSLHEAKLTTTNGLRKQYTALAVLGAVFFTAMLLLAIFFTGLFISAIPESLLY